MGIEKIKSHKELKETVETLKRQSKRIVFTNGCFDILHIGHTRYLQKAKELGDILIVAINTDASVRGIKGKDRPITPQEERAEVLASLECVDFVTFFDEPDPLNTITELQPDILVKGGDWEIDQIVGREVVEAKGGKVISIPPIEGVSTSRIIERILKSYTYH